MKPRKRTAPRARYACLRCRRQKLKVRHGFAVQGYQSSHLEFDSATMNALVRSVLALMSTAKKVKPQQGNQRQYCTLADF
jgi:hypothetical protein